SDLWPVLNSDLLAQVIRLTSHNQLLLEQVRQLHAEKAALQTWLAQPCYTMHLPEKCDANYQRCQGFINQCYLKVILFISLLSRQALDWTSPYKACDSPALSNWEVFLQTMSVLFDSVPNPVWQL
uniref:Uncharacterized protein n=1 Tax=Gopherus evgoodei TaxID=1825980 RepID=A0A8C4W7H7_9SAUR